MADEKQPQTIDQTEPSNKLALTSGEVNDAIALAQAREAQQYQLDWGTPEEKLRQAHICAKLLQHVMTSKKNPIIVNGELYPEYEDWLIAANFYGCTPKIVSTRFCTEYGATGFEAVCELIRVRDGAVVGRAEAMCLTDEDRWSKAPMFQLRSMAQTRAGSKVMRSVFSWILVLAGYKPTPAEEIKDVDPQSIKAKQLASKFVEE